MRLQSDYTKILYQKSQISFMSMILFSITREFRVMGMEMLWKGFKALIKHEIILINRQTLTVSK